MERFPQKTDDLMENARRNRPGSRMLQILQGQKSLYFCALVHACMRNTKKYIHVARKFPSKYRT